MGNKRLNTESFIQKAQAVHGLGKYDYSQTVFAQTKQKVRIICLAHGAFEQPAGSHLAGRGCIKCGIVTALSKPRKTTAHGTDDFIKSAKAKHGEAYDYSLVDCYGLKEKVRIICPAHGEFDQKAQSHLVGYGCSKCGQEILRAKHLARRHDKARFLIRAHAMHGDKYDYSKVDYKTQNDTITIICPKHGEFYQKPAVHFRAGCKACGRDGLKTTSEEFIKLASEIHGAKYSYGHAIYSNARTLITITCPEHGDFRQSPVVHLRGAACGKCNSKRQFAPRPEKFIENAHRIHGEKFDYSRVNYKSSTTKVVIICPSHGAFEQKPRVHLTTTGCPACGKERRDAGARLDWVERASGRISRMYLLKIFSESEVFYKVGITYRTIGKRYHSARLLNGYQYETLAQYTSTNAAAVYDWEQSILETFAHLAYTPKRRFGGETECFSNANEILAIFPL